MTDSEVVVKLALATVGASEVPAASNAGPFVERCQAVTGNTRGDPWCASWVAMIGQTALGKSWPLPLTGGCQALYDFAKKKKLVRETGVVGDVFLIWHPELGRFAHTGFIVGLPSDTVSGNTSGSGSREGWIVGRRVWTFKPEDRFIHWERVV